MIQKVENTVFHDQQTTVNCQFEQMNLDDNTSFDSSLQAFETTLKLTFTDSIQFIKENSGSLEDSSDYILEQLKVAISHRLKQKDEESEV